MLARSVKSSPLITNLVPGLLRSWPVAAALLIESTVAEDSTTKFLGRFNSSAFARTVTISLVLAELALIITLSTLLAFALMTCAASRKSSAPDTIVLCMTPPAAAPFIPRPTAAPVPRLKMITASPAVLNPSHPSACNRSEVERLSQFCRVCLASIPVPTTGVIPSMKLSISLSPVFHSPV